jgi:protein-disulfide isomerase
MRLLARRVAVCLAICCIAAAQQPASSAETAAETAKDRLEQYVRHLFVWGPEVTVDISDPRHSELAGFNEFVVTAKSGGASQKETYYVSPDGAKLIRGIVYDLGKDPFAETREQIDKSGHPAFGPDSAPVQIVVFSDFQCSFCREEAKSLRREIPSAYPDQVRVVYKDLPLDAIHPWARPAAIAGQCIFEQKEAAFWPYHDWVFENQSQITPENFRDKLADFVPSVGLDMPQLQPCLDKRATEAKVNASVAEAQRLGVNSTPTLFVNGRRLVGQVAWPVLKRVIEHEIRYRKEHGAASECCELKLPAAAVK